jgi:DNA-binding Lrp family transcriptional regulator
LDAIDIQILDELKKDSRKSFNIIADGVGKTEATVRRRVNKLIEDNVIRKFTIDYSINSKPRTQATVKIEPDFKEIKNILKELEAIDEVTNIWRLSGNCGIFIKVEIESIEKFNPLIEEKISQIKGCKIIETCFITDIIK